MKDKKLGLEPAFPLSNIVLAAIKEGKKTDGLGISKRAYAAIKLGVPDSGEEWLDEMIIKSNRRKDAMAALQGMLGNMQFVKANAETAYGNNIQPDEFLIKTAYSLVDELSRQ